MRGSSNTSPALLPRAAALSLLEVLVTLALFSLLTVLAGAAWSTLASWRGLSALQQLAADLDEARIHALAEQQEVWLAFAGDPSLNNAFRAYVRCQMHRDPDGSQRLHPVGNWRQLPTGQIFSLTSPATPSTSPNLLTDEAARQPVLLAGVEQYLPCLGFGPLGQVLHPPLGQPRLALAEGEVHLGMPRLRHGPEACRWLVLHRHTGHLLLLP
jgi:type II secretory pathway pseudopilin PulG